MNKLPKDPNPVRGGCMQCPGTHDLLPLDEVLYMGFGGYTVTKDGNLYYEGDPNGAWEGFKTLAEIEVEAAKEPDADWRVVLNNPMRGGTWQRHGAEEWVLVESNMGFA